MTEPGLCAALFDTPNGTGVCEQFGHHDRHSGVVTVGVFRCHTCRRPLADGCRCTPPRPRRHDAARPAGNTP